MQKINLLIETEKNKTLNDSWEIGVKNEKAIEKILKRAKESCNISYEI